MRIGSRPTSSGGRASAPITGAARPCFCKSWNIQEQFPRLSRNRLGNGSETVALPLGESWSRDLQTPPGLPSSRRLLPYSSSLYPEPLLFGPARGQVLSSTRWNFPKRGDNPETLAPGCSGQGKACCTVEGELGRSQTPDARQPPPPPSSSFCCCSCYYCS